jgi:hypothetical protein
MKLYSVRFVISFLVPTLFACGGGTPTEPTRTSVTVAVGAFSPLAGSTLTSGNAFSIPRTFAFSDIGSTFYATAFVRDDGTYSRWLECGSGQGGDLGGAISGVLNSDFNGRVLYDFGRGHRVNLVLLLGDRAVCEGDTVVPQNATVQRVDVPLNWSIQ